MKTVMRIIVRQVPVPCAPDTNETKREELLAKIKEAEAE